MNVSRIQSINIITEIETTQIMRASVEHFAIPIIAGFSMDEVSQQQYEEMGGKGKKPEPLSPEKKLEFYNRIKNFITPFILQETAKLVNSVLPQSLENFSNEELCLKITALRERVVEIEPNWSALPELFKDESYLFKQLQKSTLLKVDLISFHDRICPIMGKYRDSGELFARIRVDELLS